MGTIIGTIFTAIATAVAGVFCLKASKNRQRREAENDVKKAEDEMKRKKDALKKAIFEKDDETVNATVTNLLVCLSLTALIVGCAAQKTETVYIAADRRIVSITNEYGVACKAVPDLVFSEMCEKLLELQELKKEQKVDKRVGQ